MVERQKGPLPNPRNHTFLTISKYPPYMSGHSFESMNQNRALLEITGKKHHELTYDGEVYDKTTNFNNSPSLMAECESVAEVHRVGCPTKKNLKVFDGALTKAFTGKAIELVEQGVDVISTFYLDPHAYVANSARDYGQHVLGRRVIAAHKAVGSDVLDSVANHHNDGQGKLLLMEYLNGDLLLAVSQYTKDELVRNARELLPGAQADKVEQDTQVLYAPFDNEYYEERDEEGIKNLRDRLSIPDSAKVISFFGRVFPEKGIDDLMRAFAAVKKNHPDTTLVIGGQGVELERLKQLAIDLRIPDIVFTGGVSEEDKRAIMQMSEIGVIPTRPVTNFVETLCISALEYLAAGTPLIVTPIGGVPEAAGEHSIYTPPNNPQKLFSEINALLANPQVHQRMIEEGVAHVKSFNYQKITREFMDLVEQVF